MNWFSDIQSAFAPLFRNMDNGAPTPDDLPEFSFYKAPISNTKPVKTLNLRELHRMLTGEKYKDVTASIRSCADEEEYRTLKANYLDSVTVSGRFSRRKKEHIQEYTGYIVIDFDDVDDLDEVKQELRNDPHTLLLFTSPGGHGLKWIVRSDSGPDQHEAVFREISRYVEYKYDLSMDQSGKDVSRACFLCHDPEAFLNPDISEVKPFTGAHMNDSRTDARTSQNKRFHTEDNSPELLASVDYKISQLEELDLDLTYLYEHWINMGFSMASLGEDGRAFYHRLSRLSSKYNEQGCNAKFDNLLESYDPDKIGIDYFFDLVEKILPDEREPESRHFPEEIFELLPPFLKKACDHFDDAVEQTMLLMGLLTVLSGCFPRVYGIYHKKVVSANLYSMIVAPASTGKSVLQWAYKIGYKVHKALKDRYENATDDEQKKIRSSLYLPTNISASAFAQDLDKNKGQGILYSTEIDTLASTFDQEWGQFSDNLRKAFHHETVDMRRQTEKLAIEIQNPFLSVLLSGTPNQVHNLIHNTEDGLLSRFAILEIESVPEFADVFADEELDLEQIFERYGEELRDFYLDLEDRNEKIRFNLTEEQKQSFVRKYEKILPFRYELNGPGFVSIVKRMALIQFKICMILTLTRYINKDDIPDELFCSEDDFEISERIAEFLMHSMEQVYERISEQEAKPAFTNKKKSELYEQLPDEFEWKEALSLADQIGISQSTLHRMLKKKLFARIRKGVYRKISPEKMKKLKK